MKWINVACLVLTIAATAPVEARNHHQANRDKPVAQADEKTAAEKASADTDEALDKRIKSICRGC